MAYAPHRGGRGHAHRNFAGLPSFARLHPNAVGWGKIILRSRESRYPGRRRRLVNVGAVHRTARAIEVNRPYPASNQPSAQHFEGGLRGELFKCFAIAREKKSLHHCLLVRESERDVNRPDRFLLRAAGWTSDPG